MARASSKRLLFFGGSVMSLESVHVSRTALNILLSASTPQSCAKLPPLFLLRFGRLRAVTLPPSRIPTRYRSITR
ncbi:hypothetical protein M3J09_000590 [Ascochyta lentis]